MPTDLSLRVGHLIRGTHPYQFRSGQWARVAAVVVVRGRDCYQVVFPDGVTDLWVCEDPSDPYEFSESALTSSGR